MLFYVLDELLGTATKMRVLRVLLQLDSPVSGKEAKRLARVRSAASMWTALDELSDLGILRDSLSTASPANLRARLACGESAGSDQRRPSKRLQSIRCSSP